MIELDTERREMWLSRKAIHKMLCCYRVFHGFGQAKFHNDGLALSSKPIFNTAPSALKKTMPASKGVKIDSKISNSCP